MPICEKNQYQTRAQRIGWPCFALIISMSVSGCALSEPPTNEPANSSPDSVGETPQREPLRLPSIRLSARSATAINTLMADRENDRVIISGTIVQRAAILEGWLYEVEDDTGRLWVLTNSSEPDVGAIATVEGIVRYEPIVVGEIDAGSVYLEERAYKQENN